MGLIIASMRRIPQEVAALKAGRWQSSAGLNMQGSTLGIFGYGQIGALLARYAKAFEMKPIAWGREGSIRRARADGVEIAASRQARFEQSYILAVTIRLYPETAGIVTAADLARMKPTSLFVNTSRATLVQPGALLAALRNGRPGMATVDVFDNEPVFGASDPLVAMDNVVATPHLGYVTQSNLESYFTYAFDQSSPGSLESPPTWSIPRLWRRPGPRFRRKPGIFCAFLDIPGAPTRFRPNRRKT